MSEAKKRPLNAVVREQAGGQGANQIERESDAKAGGFVVQKNLLQQVERIAPGPDVGKDTEIENTAGDGLMLPDGIIEEQEAGEVGDALSCDVVEGHGDFVSHSRYSQQNQRKQNIEGMLLPAEVAGESLDFVVEPCQKAA